MAATVDQTALEGIVSALEAALIARDPDEAGHIERATAYATALAERIDPSLLDDPATLAGFRLHDVGKIALPEATLNRRGPLVSGAEGDETAGQLDLFDTVDRDSAREVLRLWQAHPAYRASVARISTRARSAAAEAA